MLTISPKTELKHALDILFKMMSNWIHIYRDYFCHELTKNVKKLLNFLHYSFKAVKYREKILQIKYDVIMVIAPKRHSGIIYYILTLRWISDKKCYLIQSFESGPDVAIKKIPDMNIMFLQVKVDANVRTDTNKPNNSPIVLVKPYYR